MGAIPMARVFDMPSRATCDVPSIRQWVLYHLQGRTCVIDPFARNCRLAHWTNDIDPETAADEHLDAVDWLRRLVQRGIRADAAIIDPPYSPTQMVRVKYGGRRQTQTSRLYAEVRTALTPVLTPDAIVLTFGWQSVGMGKTWPITDLLLVCHGGGHYDTICVAQSRPTQDAPAQPTHDTAHAAGPGGCSSATSPG